MNDAMILTFLGTAGGMPTPERNVSGLALQRGGAWDLFDCGEGTQHQIIRTSLAPSRLARIFISHLHGDHVYGLFGLLGTRSMLGISTPLHIVGPVGLRALIDAVLAGSSMHLKYELRIQEIPNEGGPVVEDARLRIDAVPVDHRVVSFAWWLREAPAPGALDVERARALGVPEGPLFGRLKAGETVTLEDGRGVEPTAVLGPPLPGRELVIAGDNRDPERLLERVGDVPLLVHEATFTEAALSRLPDDKGHSTAARVGRAAATAGVRNLVLTHFSARYSIRDGSIEQVRAEAQEHYRGRLFLAQDFERYALGRDAVLECKGGSDES